MKTFLLILLSVFFYGSLHAAEEKFENEADYSKSWCMRNGGDSHAILPDRTRPDCLLDTEAIEFDFGYKSKPYECTGQALHYAAVTGKSPLCILIQREGISDEEFIRATKRVHVPLKCMNRHGKIFICPE
ncbi:MAG: hypothetical protein ACNYPH_03715 [Gammaproteobacteria bacterium WSBS_2016_MAG_OTU1]